MAPSLGRHLNAVHKYERHLETLKLRDNGECCFYKGVPINIHISKEAKIFENSVRHTGICGHMYVNNSKLASSELTGYRCFERYKKISFHATSQVRIFFDVQFCPNWIER